MLNETHARLTKHLRSRFKAAGIKAHCSGYVSCGVMWIRVTPPTAEARFNEQEQRTLLTIAKVNGLTLARGMEINPEQLTAGVGQLFVVPADKQ